MFFVVKSKPATAAGVTAGGPGTGAPTTGKYIPPSQRGDKKPGERGESFGSRMQQDDQATVRVTNLSEETQESDLRELFGYFGQIKRVFLAKDKITQQSKVSSHWGIKYPYDIAFERENLFGSCPQQCLKAVHDRVHKPFPHNFLPHLLHLQVHIYSIKL